VHGEAEYADYAVPRKLCHSFSELQHQQRHHQRYQRHDEAEYANYAEQKKKFHDIDIAGELLRKSSEGIAEVDEAMLAADCLQLQLAPVKQAFQYVSDCVEATTLKQSFPHPGGDDLERCAARALQQVDELIAQEAPRLPAVAMKSLKILQMLSRDIMVLLCSRFVSQTSLRSQGMPEELELRLKAACGQGNIKSLLGNTKYHLFTPDLQFKTRPNRGSRATHRRRERAAARGGEPSTTPWSEQAFIELGAVEPSTTPWSKPMFIDFLGAVEPSWEPWSRPPLDEPMKIHFPSGAGKPRGAWNPSPSLL